MARRAWNHFSSNQNLRASRRNMPCGAGANLSRIVLNSSPKFDLVPQAFTKTDEAARTNETCTIHFSTRASLFLRRASLHSFLQLWTTCKPYTWYLQEEKTEIPTMLFQDQSCQIVSSHQEGQTVRARALHDTSNILAIGRAHIIV